MPAASIYIRGITNLAYVLLPLSTNQTRVRPPPKALSPTIPPATSSNDIPLGRGHRTKRRKVREDAASDVVEDSDAYPDSTREESPDFVPDENEESVRRKMPAPRPHRSASTRSCHQCHKVRESKPCSSCAAHYCFSCMQRRYQVTPDMIPQDGWSCPRCNDTCDCSACRNRTNVRPRPRRSVTVGASGPPAAQPYTPYLTLHKASITSLTTISTPASPVMRPLELTTPSNVEIASTSVVQSTNNEKPDASVPRSHFLSSSPVPSYLSLHESHSAPPLLSIPDFHREASNDFDPRFRYMGDLPSSQDNFPADAPHPWEDEDVKPNLLELERFHRSQSVSAWNSPYTPISGEPYPLSLEAVTQTASVASTSLSSPSADSTYSLHTPNYPTTLPLSASTTNWEEDGPPPVVPYNHPYLPTYPVDDAESRNSLRITLPGTSPVNYALYSPFGSTTATFPPPSMDPLLPGVSIVAHSSLSEFEHVTDRDVEDIERFFDTNCVAGVMDVYAPQKPSSSLVHAEEPRIGLT